MLEQRKKKKKIVVTRISMQTAHLDFKQGQLSEKNIDNVGWYKKEFRRCLKCIYSGNGKWK